MTHDPGMQTLADYIREKSGLPGNESVSLSNADPYNLHTASAEAVDLLTATIEKFGRGLPDEVDLDSRIRLLCFLVDKCSTIRP